MLAAVIAARLARRAPSSLNALALVGRRPHRDRLPRWSTISRSSSRWRRPPASSASVPGWPLDGVEGALAKALAISVGAQLATLPFTVPAFSQMPLLGAALNLVAVPWTGLCLVARPGVGGGGADRSGAGGRARSLVRSVGAAVRLAHRAAAASVGLGADRAGGGERDAARDRAARRRGATALAAGAGAARARARDGRRDRADSRRRCSTSARATRSCCATARALCWSMAAGGRPETSADACCCRRWRGWA